MAVTSNPQVPIWPPYMPPRTDWAAPFWRGLAAGRLALQHCPNCDSTTYPPVDENCATCGAQKTWGEAQGHARLWSWTTFHREYVAQYPLPPPYTVLLVELSEGPRMLATLAPDAATAALTCDMPLTFSAVELASGVFVPGFRPAR